MTPKQTIEKMSSTLQYSSVNRQVVYKWYRRFSTEWEDSGAKNSQPTELNKMILTDSALRYQGRPGMF